MKRHSYYLSGFHGASREPLILSATFTSKRAVLEAGHALMKLPDILAYMHVFAVMVDGRTGIESGVARFK